MWQVSRGAAGVLALRLAVAGDRCALSEVEGCACECRALILAAGGGGHVVKADVAQLVGGVHEMDMLRQYRLRCDQREQQ